MRDLILTFDIGTTGNKCSLFDSKGKPLFAETVDYETYYPRPGWSEQNPEDFWKSVISGTGKLLQKSGADSSAIAVIGLSGHMNGCIPVDGQGNILFNNIIHSDSRSTKECRDILNTFGNKEFYDITGHRVDPHYTLPKILWIRNRHPELYSRCSYVLNSKDYILFKLTGNLGITDYSDASMTGMLDVNRRKWSEDLVSELGLDLRKLPVIMKSTDVAGYLSNEAAALLGLKAGTPVIAGGGDAACATKGAGVVELGEAYNYIGSSSWIIILNDRPVKDGDARIFNLYDLDGEHCNVCGTMQCATISYDWVLNNIGRYEVEKAKELKENVFDLMDSIAAGVPAGANGIVFLPYLMGERTPLWDENTRGAFIGFGLYNKKEDLFRAVYEGIAFALRSILDVYEENGIKVDTLALIGGGAKSRLWNEIMCNVYGKRVKVHRFPREATSLGAAIAAGVGVGLYRDFKEAASVVEFDRVYDPEMDKVEEYRRFYGIYRMMYPCLKPVFDAMAI